MSLTARAEKFRFFGSRPVFCPHRNRMKEETNQSLDLFSHLEIQNGKPEESAQDLPLLSFSESISTQEEGPQVVGTPAPSPQEEIQEESYGSSFYEEDDFSEQAAVEFVSSQEESSPETAEVPDLEIAVGTPEQEDIKEVFEIESATPGISSTEEKPSAPKRKTERDSGLCFYFPESFSGTGPRSPNCSWASPYFCRRRFRKNKSDLESDRSYDPGPSYSCGKDRCIVLHE